MGNNNKINLNSFDFDDIDNLDSYYDEEDDGPSFHKIKSDKGFDDGIKKEKHQKKQKVESIKQLKVNDEVGYNEKSHSQQPSIQKKQQSYDKTEKKFNTNFKPIKNQVQEQTQKTTGINFTPSENSHEIKGTLIDFNGVLNIEQVENEHNGKMTYGIKFYFKGKKGLFRVIWFNQNQQERDRVYTKEYLFWKGLSK